MNEIQTRPGLADLVQDAQQIFKAALMAISRPGKIVEVYTVPPSVSGAFELESATQTTECVNKNVALTQGFGPGMVALALACCDMDTSIWLDSDCNNREARHHLRFHCGSPLADDCSEADFAFISNASEMPDLSEFKAGVPEYPDRSATLVIKAGLGAMCGKQKEEKANAGKRCNTSAGDGKKYLLSGPGVKGAGQQEYIGCRISGLPEWFEQAWAENHSSYPLGVDVLLVDEAPLTSPIPHFLLMGLPRSVSFKQSALDRNVQPGEQSCM